MTCRISQELRLYIHLGLGPVLLLDNAGVLIYEEPRVEEPSSIGIITVPLSAAEVSLMNWPIGPSILELSMGSVLPCNMW